MLSTARQPESLLLQHTKLATSDSQSRHGEEGSRSQSTEAELGSGIGGAGKIVAEGEVQENLPWEGGRGGGDGNPRASRGSRRGPCSSPASHLCFSAARWVCISGSVPGKHCPGFPKADLDSFSAYYSAFLDTHSRLGTKRFPTAVSPVGSVPAPARVGQVSFRFSAPRLCSHQATAQARKDTEVHTHLVTEK